MRKVKGLWLFGHLSCIYRFHRLQRLLKIARQDNVASHLRVSVLSYGAVQPMPTGFNPYRRQYGVRFITSKHARAVMVTADTPRTRRQGQRVGGAWPAPNGGTGCCGSLHVQPGYGIGRHVTRRKALRPG
jgi:hypothetical protein